MYSDKITKKSILVAVHIQLNVVEPTASLEIRNTAGAPSNVSGRSLGTKPHTTASLEIQNTAGAPLHASQTISTHSIRRYDIPDDDFYVDDVEEIDNNLAFGEYCMRDRKFTNGP